MKISDWLWVKIAPICALIFVSALLGLAQVLGMPSLAHAQTTTCTGSQDPDKSSYISFDINTGLCEIANAGLSPFVCREVGCAAFFTNINASLPRVHAAIRGVPGGFTSNNNFSTCNLGTGNIGPVCILENPPEGPTDIVLEWMGLQAPP